MPDRPAQDAQPLLVRPAAKVPPAGGRDNWPGVDLLSGTVRGGYRVFCCDGLDVVRNLLV